MWRSPRCARPVRGGSAVAIGSWVRPASARWRSGSGPRGRHINGIGVPDVVDIGFTWLAGSAQRSAGQHRGQAAHDGPRLRGVGGAPRRAADRRPQCPVPGRHRTDRRPARRHLAGGPAGLRRHRAHVGPLLHPGGRVAGGEGAPDGPARRRAPNRPEADQARAREAEILRRWRSRTAASASSLGRMAATALPVRWIVQAS